jgi:hypothetical protein
MVQSARVSISSEVTPFTRTLARSTGSIGGERARGGNSEVRGWRNLVSSPDLSSSNCVFAKFASSRCPFANFDRITGVEGDKWLFGAFVKLLDDKRTSAR